MTSNEELLSLWKDAFESFVAAFDNPIARRG